MLFGEKKLSWVEINQTKLDEQRILALPMFVQYK